MKKLTQKLVLSVLTMALVVVALGTSTFAWFTLQNSASVQSFTGQVTSGEGIEISLGVGTAQTVTYDASTDWYTSMPSGVIQTLINTKYANLKFKDITSTDGRTFTSLKGLVDSSADYIEFTLFFRSRTSGLAIAWTSAALGGTEKEWNVNVESFKHIDGLLYGVTTVPATPNVVSDKLFVAAWAGARISVSNSADTTTFVHQEATKAYTAANAVGSRAGNSVVQPSVSYLYAGNLEFGAASYAKASGAADTLVLPDFAATADIAADRPTVVTLTSSSPVGGYYTGSAKIRVWIEGWDADTYDSIFSTALTAQLGFEKK